MIICGVCTNICVLHTVANAKNRDWEVTQQAKFLYHVPVK
ncbi:isochorismatase family protein [Chloroflexota bacterium]